MKSRIILGVALATLLVTSVRAQVSATDQAATVVMPGAFSCMMGARYE